MKVTTRPAEGPARAVTQLAVISLLNCSLIGPLQRLITLTNGSLPTAGYTEVSGWLRPAWLLSYHWVSNSSVETHADVMETVCTG